MSEPVGYVSRNYVERGLPESTIHRVGFVLDVPVYTHPADQSELVIASEALLEQIRLYSECKFGWHGIRESSENLRAVLDKAQS